jgi:hypothetical protein
MKFLIGLCLLLTILLGGVAGAGGYWYYTQAEQMTTSISQNNSLVNDSLREIQDIRFELISRNLDLGKTASFQTYTQDLEGLRQDIDTYEEMQITRLEKVDPGMNSDTESFSQVTTQTLQGFDQTLDNLQENFDFATCMASNLNDRYEWTQDISQRWSTTDETFAEVQFVELVRRTAEDFQENSTKLDLIVDCFQDFGFQGVIDEAYEISLREEKARYENLANALNILANSVEDFNRNNFAAASDELLAALDQDTTFTSDTLEKFTSIIEQADIDTQSSLQQNYEVFSNKQETLRKKWFLNPNENTI